jgi:hypothetical protein
LPGKDGVWQQRFHIRRDRQCERRHHPGTRPLFPLREQLDRQPQTEPICKIGRGRPFRRHLHHLDFRTLVL